MRRRWRVAAAATALLAAAVAAAAAALLLSAPGLRWALAAAAALSDGALQVERAEGRLVGPLRLEGVAVRAGGTGVHIASVEADWLPGALWRERRLDVSTLRAQGVVVSAGGGGEGGGALPAITAPLAVRLPDAQLRGLRVVTQDGASVAVAEVDLAAQLDREALTVDSLDVRDVTVDAAGAGAQTIDAVALAARYDGRDVAVRRLEVRAPQGRLSASGTLAADMVRDSRLSVRWSATLGGRDIEGEGEIDGSRERIGFRQRLRAPAPLRVEGTINDPLGTPAWTARAEFDALDAGLLDARARGVTVSGSVAAAGAAQHLDLQLRSQLHDPGLGPWDLSMDASRDGEAWRVARLALDQRDGRGRLQGSAQIVPAGGALRVDAQLRGADIDVAGVAAARIDADVALATDPAQPWRLSVAVDGVALGGAPPLSASLQGSGNAAAHELAIDVQRDAQALHLAARGGIDGGEWSGSIVDGVVRIDGERRLWQAGAAPARAAPAAAEVSAWCWEGAGTRACAGGRWQRAGDAHAAVELERLDVADLPPALLPAALAIDGVITGRAAVTFAGTRLVAADAALRSERIGFEHTDADGVRTLTALLGVGVDAATREDGLHVDAGARLDPSGHLRAALRLPGWTPGVAPQRQRLDGGIDLAVDDLGRLAALLPGVGDPRGRIDGRLEIAGTLAAPALSGRVALREGSAVIARAGITLSEVGIELRGGEAGRLAVTGSARSGNGTIALDGGARVAGAGDWSLRLGVSGREFEAARLPDVLLVASPDLELSATPGRIDVRGSVEVPSADVRLSAPKGTIERSPDVVVIGTERGAQPAAPWRMHARIELRLGDAVNVHGYGFEGRVAGAITIIEEPGRATVAEGELRAVDARYTAYGQVLTIDTGRLIFAGGPVDDPAVDVRAVRVVDEVTAGVKVSGRLQQPDLALFSEPPLADGDVLSYLVIGRPMAQASSAQGQLLLQAAASLGGGSGPGLASRIAGTFGLTELGLSGSAADRETALRLGRYLSPRLYLTYLIGLWEHGSALQLRYTLTERLTVETQTGTRSSVDLLYSIER